MRSFALRSSLVCLGSAALLWAAPAGAVSVLLDDFESPDYDGFSFNGADSGDNPDDLSFADLIPVATGGNPGGFGRVEHFHEVGLDEFGETLNGDGFTSLQSFFNDRSVTYNPAVQGAISVLEFRLDILLPEPNAASSFSDLFFLVQDSQGGAGAGLTPISGAPGWQTIIVSGLGEGDFSGRDFAGNRDLSFGFGFLSGGDVSFGSELITLDVDNFEVLVTPIPEPGSALLIGLGALLLGFRRLRV